jgi:hypothetical protein
MVIIYVRVYPCKGYYYFEFIVYYQQLRSYQFYMARFYYAIYMKA